jgi:serine/threonine-protein kinase
MELVEGPTLADRIAQGPIPVDEALPIAKQIAEALEAAHEQGIIHRDLKPANIKVRPDGTVKVLDFGLAKAMEPVSGTHIDATASPTITSPAMRTGVGMLLGTAAYMSPEQARGKAVDKRSDIWAFGCVLYEMLTCKRTFDGEDISDTLAAVLRSEPDWSALPSSLPPAVAVLCRGCLVKNAYERVGDISTVRFVLSNASVLLSPNRENRDRNRRTLVFVAAAVALLVLTIAVAGYVRFSPRAVAEVIRSALVLPGRSAPEGAPFAMAIAPDGRYVVYTGNGGTQVFVRMIDTLEPVAIATGSGIQSMTISPDGDWVAFVDGPGRGTGTLKKVPIRGGTPTVLAESIGEVRGLSWGEDGTILLSSLRTGVGLRRISSGGGELSVLTKLDESLNERDHLWPRFLPGGGAVLFTILRGTRGDAGAQIAILDLATRTYRVLLEGVRCSRVHRLWA